MARRYAGKASPRTASPVRPSGRRAQTEDVAEETLRERLAALEHERDALRAALEHERARLRRLEELNATARDRLSWALDSLHDLLDTKR